MFHVNHLIDDSHEISSLVIAKNPTDIPKFTAVVSGSLKVNNVGILSIL